MGPKRYRCALCRTPEFPWGIEFESHDPQCPRCKATGDMAILPLVNVHLYFPDQSNGPILGMHGLRYRVACKPNAANPNGVPCTPDPRVVTCPECKKTEDFKKSLNLLESAKGAVLLD